MQPKCTVFTKPTVVSGHVLGLDIHSHSLTRPERLLVPPAPSGQVPYTGGPFLSFAPYFYCTCLIHNYHHCVAVVHSTQYSDALCRLVAQERWAVAHSQVCRGLDHPGLCERALLCDVPTMKTSPNDAFLRTRLTFKCRLSGTDFSVVSSSILYALVSFLTYMTLCILCSYKLA